MAFRGTSFSQWLPCLQEAPERAGHKTNGFFSLFLSFLWSWCMSHSWPHTPSSHSFLALAPSVMLTVLAPFLLIVLLGLSLLQFFPCPFLLRSYYSWKLSLASFHALSGSLISFTVFSSYLCAADSHIWFLSRIFSWALESSSEPRPGFFHLDILPNTPSQQVWTTFIYLLLKLVAVNDSWFLQKVPASLNS